MRHTYHLVVSCPDTKGIVAAVSQFIAVHDGLIIEADHHTDINSQQFFMRYEIDADSLAISLDDFIAEFQSVASRFTMQFAIFDAARKKRMLILASKQAHCLEDLLYRWQSKELHCEIVAVVSNHDALRKRTEWYGLPFHYVPIRQNKAEHFAKVNQLIADYHTDVIVLARYMQVLPETLCQQYSNQIINIHHSFLPSFVGARPYQQAYNRGVKLIGATAHYVTQDLDEGPIITQDVAHISHRQNLEEYIRLGKDVERLVLARAVKAHLEDRVIAYRNKTVVFG